MDGQTAERLFAAIVSYVEERGGYVTKTKLLKLLYIFDVEYFRARRQTYTGFAWKFYHLGPWAAEYEPLLQSAVAKDILTERFGKHDTPLYRAPERTDPSALQLSAADEGILRTVLNRWSDVETSDILDYVYFNTEPMRAGVRSQSLDFSAIQELPPPYKRSSSGVSDKEILRKRAAFREKQTKLERPQSRITPPRYDEQFDRAMATMDTDD